MFKKSLKRKIKKQNTSLIHKYLDILNDLLNEGRSLEESLHILNSKISKSKEKIKTDTIIKKLNGKFNDKNNENHEVEYFFNIFSKKQLHN